MTKIYRNILKNKNDTEELICQQGTDESIILSDHRTLKNKLDTIRDNAEPNQNAISRVNVDNKTFISTNKEDTLTLALSKDIETIIVGKELKLIKRMLVEKSLQLHVDPNTGVDDSREDTPFKTIQAAISYVKEYYAYLEEGCVINIKPGKYAEKILVNNFDNRYNSITFRSVNFDNIPIKGQLKNDDDYVTIQNLKIYNNGALINFMGISLTCLDVNTMEIGPSSTGGTYVVQCRCEGNLNVIFNRCKTYGGQGNLQAWKYYYGCRVFYSNILIRDCCLGGFNNGSGGNSAPLRLAENSDVTILKCNFRDNVSYDIVAEEAIVKVRLCTILDGKPLKTNISATTFFAQGN
ncbi:TPA: hypothetical protein ACJFE8_001281 [Clostridium sporogenes]